MNRKNKSKLFLWAGIYSGILAIFIYLFLIPTKSQKKVERSANQKYIKILNVETGKKELSPRKSKKKLETDHKDDLKQIKGIGPVIENLLNENDIFTFSKLSDLKVDDLRAILLQKKIRLANFETWPEQAKLLCN